MPKRNVAKELAKTRALIAALPTAVRVPYRKRLGRIEARARASVAGTAVPGSVPGERVTRHPAKDAPPRVAKPSAPSGEYVDFDQRKADDEESHRSALQRVARGDQDWDLALANELDKLYQAAAEEANKLKSDLWPYIAAALVGLFLYAKARSGGK